MITSMIMAVLLVACTVDKPLEQDKVLKVEMVQHLVTKEIWEETSYDFNEDGFRDYVTWTWPGTTHPEFYFVDRDYDSNVDVVYRDKYLRGTCNGMRVVWGPHIPIGGRLLTFEEWVHDRVWHIMAEEREYPL